MPSDQHLSRAPLFAIVTPFDSGGGVDHASLRDYVVWLHSNGVTRIVVAGTTGEFPSLTLSERRAVLETARGAFPGQVVSHVSTCSIAETRELMAHAREFSDAMLLLPPYYHADATQEGVREYLVRVAADCPLPLYIYNFPRHTQFNIKPALFHRLHQDLPMLRGIKDSGGKWDQSIAYKQGDPELEVIVGSDGAALRVLLEGLDGTVTGGANPVPRLIIAVHERHTSGDAAGAKAAQEKLDEWTNLRKSAGVHEIALVKAALSQLIPGFPAHLRPPLLGAESLNIATVINFARAAGVT